MKRRFLLLFFILLISTSAIAQVGTVLDEAVDIVTDTSSFGNNLSLADSDVQQALDTLDDLVVSGGGSGAFVGTFTNSDLSAGVLTLTHSLNEQDVQVDVYDENYLYLISDSVDLIGANTVEIDINSYGTISGTWTAVVLSSGGTSSSGASFVSVPPTASTSCTLGEISMESGYSYFCVATNTWERTAIATWGSSSFILLSDGTSSIVLDDGSSKIQLTF